MMERGTVWNMQFHFQNKFEKLVLPVGFIIRILYMNFTFKWPCIVTNLIIKPTRCTNFLKFYFGMKLYMFRTVTPSIIRSYSLYTQQWCMSHRFVDSFWAGSGLNWSCSTAVYKPVWHIPSLSVQWITPDDGQRNCLKHVEFHFQNKFEKISASSWLYYKEIFHDARSHERKIVTFMSVKFQETNFLISGFCSVVNEVYPFWNVTQWWVVVGFWCFKIAYWSHLHGWSSPVFSWTAWPLKMGLIGCPEELITNYQSTQYNIWEEWRP
jgi:hypothetical protein